MSAWWRRLAAAALATIASTGGASSGGVCGVFSFGDAAFFGSVGSVPLGAPVAGMAATPTGRGYWLLVQGGNVVALGDALVFALE